MLKRVAILTVAAALTMPAAVLAQTAAPGANSGGLVELDDDRTDVNWQGRSIDDLEDMDVYNTGGDKIGEVEEVLGDASGRISAVAVEFGGTLGIGDKQVVVPLDRLQLGQDDRLVTDMVEEDLARLQEWED
ncbi:PRC-barrel domain-containing protein (plasmid) [Skermanella mucosa]|uniref:PRC-barrel domain-containing protein n=1 Tax=Skermanella mucosa TaxID=1789672 RepID=UPI00192BBE98|nr:PRC-barrel domain-containing protein [Skermanella mucosa]UEM24595.1 PRC-barrel domain-containing protein [Skermanella mucosa]